MNILITGCNGFIGKNLSSHLTYLTDSNLILANRHNFKKIVDEKASILDFIFHLAGENRSNEEQDFINNNVLNTEYLIKALQKNHNKCPIVFSSSSKSKEENFYGKTKYKAEQLLIQHSSHNASQVFIFRFPNIFGKWSKPRHNSVVSTLICDLLNKNKTEIWNGNEDLELLYIDKVISYLLDCLKDKKLQIIKKNDFETTKTTVNYIYKKLQFFHNDRKTEKFKLNFNEFDKNLYSTYLSFLKIEDCIFPIKSFVDHRGSFTEFIKGPLSGQVSVFTAFPNVERGNHFHHTKVERFLISSGTALFKFKNIINSMEYEKIVSGEQPHVVETFPGWNHSIKNIGATEVSGVIWSNEVYDPQKPDTYIKKV